MADEIKLGTSPLPSGEVPTAKNAPIDVPTMLVDGMTGATLSNYMVRLHMVEHVAYGDELNARHIVNLAMDVEQFGKFVASLCLVRDQMQPVVKAAE